MHDRTQLALQRLAATPSLALAVSLALAPVGCRVLERVDHCDSLVEMVNPELAEVKFQLPDAGADAAAYEQIAEIYEGLAPRVAALNPPDSGLARSLLSYKEILDRAAKTSRSYAEELAKPAKSRAQRKERESRLKRLRSQAKNEALREAAVVRKLNALCHPE